jgi:hypothetical protein
VGARCHRLDLRERVVDLDLQEHFAERRGGLRRIAAHAAVLVAAAGREPRRPHVLGVHEHQLGRVEDVRVAANLVSRHAEGLGHVRVLIAV